MRRNNKMDALCLMCKKRKIYQECAQPHSLIVWWCGGAWSGSGANPAPAWDLAPCGGRQVGLPSAVGRPPRATASLLHAALREAAPEGSPALLRPSSEAVAAAGRHGGGGHLCCSQATASHWEGSYGEQSVAFLPQSHSGKGGLAWGRPSSVLMGGVALLTGKNAFS